MGYVAKKNGLGFSKPCALSNETGKHEKEDVMVTLLGEVLLITINVGNLHLALSQSQLMDVLVAAIVGFVAEFMVGWRLPFGIIGAIIAALVGIWFVSTEVILSMPGDPVLFGMPLFQALMGASLFTALWYLLIYHLWHYRRPYSHRRVPAEARVVLSWLWCKKQVALSSCVKPSQMVQGATAETFLACGIGGKRPVREGGFRQHTPRGCGKPLRLLRACGYER